MMYPAWQFSALLTANGFVYFWSYVLLPHPTETKDGCCYKWTNSTERKLK